MDTTHIPIAEAGPRVQDVMLTDPGAYAPSATVADAREAFASPRQKLVLVADEGRYLGAVTREAVEDRSHADTLGALAGPVVGTVSPESPTGDALAIAEADGVSRVPVVDAAGTLVGLVCLNGTRAAFCVRA